MCRRRWLATVQLELARARQERVGRVADTAANRALRLWRSRMGADFDSSWAGLEAPLLSIATAGQVAVAAGASSYLASTASQDGITAASAGAVEPGAYAGVDASGRELAGLLFTAVTAAKTAIGSGAGLQGAFMRGGTVLAMMMHTAILDTGRSADLTAMTARGYTHYVRVVSAGACSRCAILAGVQSAQRPFKRHPKCACTAAPENDPNTVTGRFASPTDYFESLSPSEQDKVFTKAGAEAVRAGADPITVVTARRGAPGIDYSSSVLSGKTLPHSGRRMVKTVIGRDAAGKPILGYTTGESTTRRGDFGKQNRVATGGYGKRVRLMPETIVDLTDSVQMRQVLLRDAGYLRYPAMTPTQTSTPLGGGYYARRDELIRQDRAVADAFYRDHGISLG